VKIRKIASPTIRAADPVCKPLREKVFTDERRLLSIENELAIAREIQTSILPRGVPELSRLRISAA